MNQKFLGLILLTTGSVCAGDRSPSPAALLAAATIAGAARTAGPEMPVDGATPPLISDRSGQAARREARYARAALLAAATPKTPARREAPSFSKNDLVKMGMVNQPGKNSVPDSGRSKKKQQRSPRK